jgi:dCTP deaminase
MTIQSDNWILEQCEAYRMIDPFIYQQVKVNSEGERVISYGPSSYGYDIRLAQEFKVFTNLNSTIVDPKNFDFNSFIDHNGPVCIIPPNSFALARSLEYIRMPRDVTGIVLGKSTYARIGVVANFTPLEAGWEGYITIEISNTSPCPVKVYANEGFAQILFLKGNEPCMTSYADRGGKYQGQVGITVARV